MAIRDNLGGGSSGAVLDTLEEIAANTESGKAAGALAVKELNNSLGGFQFKTVDGEKQVSVDGGLSWENFSSGAELLWTNPAPLDAFDAKTIPLDLTNFDAIIIFFVGQCGWKAESGFCILKDVKQICSVSVEQDSQYLGGSWYRMVTHTNSGITIGYPLDSATTMKTAVVPMRIYGVKLS